MSQLTVEQRFAAANALLPLVAILRGITPDESVEIGRQLYEAGFRLIEVPLNSPEPFKSITAIRQSLPDDALVGAGTVLTVDQVRELKDSGGELTVMPHADTAVIRRLCEPERQPGSYVAGANIAGFTRVADAMLALGLV